MMSTSGYDCLSSSGPSTSSAGSFSSVSYHTQDTEFSENRDDTTVFTEARRHFYTLPKRRKRPFQPTQNKLKECRKTSNNPSKPKRAWHQKPRATRLQSVKPQSIRQPRLQTTYRTRNMKLGMVVSEEIPIGLLLPNRTGTPRDQRNQMATNPKLVDDPQLCSSRSSSPILFAGCKLYSNEGPSRAPSLTPPGSDECYGTAEYGHLEDFDDDQTDFMNATDRIYENLSIQQSIAQQVPQRSRPSAAPEAQEDEASLYGRLTALLLSEARQHQSTRQKLPQVQVELQGLFKLPHSCDLNVNDESLFLRNCALFGSCVAAELRQTRQSSAEHYAVQVKRLHKSLYGLKKRNAFLAGVGRFVQRLFRTV